MAHYQSLFLCCLLITGLVISQSGAQNRVKPVQTTPPPPASDSEQSDKDNSHSQKLGPNMEVKSGEDTQEELSRSTDRISVDAKQKQKVASDNESPAAEQAHRKGLNEMPQPTSAKSTERHNVPATASDTKPKLSNEKFMGEAGSSAEAKQPSESIPVDELKMSAAASQTEAEIERTDTKSKQQADKLSTLSEDPENAETVKTASEGTEQKDSGEGDGTGNVPVGVPEPPDMIAYTRTDRSQLKSVSETWEGQTKVTLIEFTPDEQGNVRVMEFKQSYDAIRKRWLNRKTAEFSIADLREAEDGSFTGTIDPDSKQIEEQIDDSSDGMQEQQSDSGPHVTPEEEKVLTPEEQEAEDLYESAQELLATGGYSALKKAYQLLSSAARADHTEAKELVALSHFFGDYLTRNLTLVQEMMSELAEEGNPRGQLGLGIMYAAGVSVNSSQAKALVYITFAALGEDVFAQMMLGYRHLAGIGVQTSCETALIYYSKVAAKVAAQVTMSGGPAIQRLRLHESAEPSSTAGVLDDDLIQYYQFLADKGDVQAQVGLGQLYYQGGRGVAVDYDLAYEYFSLAAEGDNANAQAFLGKMYAEGLGPIKQPDDQEAFNYFEKAANQGNAIGQSGLGMMYLNGKAVGQNLKQAMKFFQLAADQSWVDGQLQLGIMHYTGQGTRRDYAAALKYFSLASQSGNVLAYYNLAQMHATGTGVMRACHTAVELYKNVAERGPWGKILMEAYELYSKGYVDAAMLKYTLAAELGYEVAQINVGYILDNDEASLYDNIEKHKRALLQWSRAAGQGSTLARLKMGDYHYYGYGTEVDYEQAAQHYRVASEQQNNAQAMFNLAFMHEMGLGMKKDLYLAKRFYDMAAETSKDAHLPVSIALAKLNVLQMIEDYTDINLLWKSVGNIHPQLYLGPSWDIYIMTFLAILLGIRYVVRAQVLAPA